MQDRIRLAVCWAMTLFMIGTGVRMAVAPASWYAETVGVAQSGPFNHHFVFDIGMAFLVCGLGYLWYALDRRGRPAAVVASLFLLLHLGYHIWNGASGAIPHDVSIKELSVLGVLTAAGVIAALPRGGRVVSRHLERLVSAVMHRRINAFEKAFDYDASYAHFLVDVDTEAAQAFNEMTLQARYRKDIPPELYYAATLPAFMAEDCGPCTQLSLTLAAYEGVSADIRRAIVTGDRKAMPADVRLAHDYARATLDHAPEAMELREEIVKRYGRRALVSLAMGMILARTYPTMKYATGFGEHCMRVVVDGEVHDVNRKAA